MSDLPLKGRTVLVTRPAIQSKPLCTLLQQAGAEALAFPLIAIQPDETALARLSQQTVRADWLIFVSPSAADIAWPALKDTMAKLACVGQPCARRLEHYAGRSVVHPTTGNDSASLLADPSFAVKAGQRVLIIRGHGGRPDLVNGLRSRGVQVELAEVYHRTENQPDWSAFDTAATSNSLYAACVTSTQIARLLFTQAGSHRHATLQSLNYCVPHERIAAYLTEAGAQNIMIIRDGDQAMVTALCQRQ